MIHIRLLSLIFSAAAGFAAAEPVLGVPVDCAPEDGCFIQNYVDADPGPGYSDFSCGALSYDGHKGTDFALPTLEAMQAGVDVVAAAAGQVLGTRDSIPDTGTAGMPEGKDCGNGVSIDHGDGWVTQYCHLKRGSVAVSTGQQVAAGDRLGQIGLSGRTEFPHLHLSVRLDDQVVDPFDIDDSDSCGVDARSLWGMAPDYVAGGIVSIAISGAVPSFDEVKAGSFATTLPNDLPALVVHGQIFGARADDVVRLRLSGPQGVIITKDITLDRTQARLFRAVGRKASGTWDSGTYLGAASLIREGTVIDSQDVEVALR